MGGRRPADDVVEDATYENPILESLDGDLHAVLQRTDLRMFAFIGIALAASYAPDYLPMPPLAASALRVFAVVCIVGGIGYTIYSSIKGKRKVGERYGVVCHACGFRPKIDDILTTADVGLCPRCGAELRVRRP